MFTTAFLIIFDVHSISPVSQGDLYLVNWAAADSSMIKLQSLCCCNKLAGTCSVTLPSTDFWITGALAGPQARRMIFFAFKMVLMPIVTASRGTCEMFWNS